MSVLSSPLEAFTLALIALALLIAEGLAERRFMRSSPAVRRDLLKRRAIDARKPRTRPKTSKRDR